MRNARITPFTKFNDVKSIIFEKTPWYVSFNRGRAEGVLLVAWEWVQSQPKSYFIKRSDKKEAKRQCKEYVKQRYNGKTDSVIGNLFLSLIISAIINWIVRQLLDYLFE